MDFEQTSYILVFSLLTLSMYFPRIFIAIVIYYYNFKFVHTVIALYRMSRNEKLLEIFAYLISSRVLEVKLYCIIFWSLDGMLRLTLEDLNYSVTRLNI